MCRHSGALARVSVKRRQYVAAVHQLQVRLMPCRFNEGSNRRRKLACAALHFLRVEPRARVAADNAERRPRRSQCAGILCTTDGSPNCRRGEIVVVRPVINPHRDRLTPPPRGGRTPTRGVLPIRWQIAALSASGFSSDGPVGPPARSCFTASCNPDLYHAQAPWRWSGRRIPAGQRMRIFFDQSRGLACCRHKGSAARCIFVELLMAWECHGEVGEARH